MAFPPIGSPHMRKEAAGMLEPTTDTGIIRSPRPKHEALRRLEAFRIVGLSHWEPGEAWPRMQAISKADPAHFHILSSGWQDVLLIEEPGSLRPADHGNEHVDGPDVQHDACALATVRGDADHSLSRRHDEDCALTGKAAV